MRKQDKIMLWPVYFDSSKTRREGRKAPRNYSISNPKLKDLQKAAETLGFKVRLEAEAAHPAIPWVKTGRLWVEKEKSKAETIIRIGKALVKIRQAQKK
jgi:signal recognition particle subunit SRP19